MKFFKNILNIIKSLFNIKEDSTNINDLLNQVDIGDIIWAKRYTNKEEKKLIPEGHTEGPYAVVDKCQSGLVCCKGTGTYNEKNNSKYFELDNLNYKLIKKTYFRLYNLIIIDNKSFIKKLDKLTDSDMKNLLKQLKINRSYYYKINEEINEVFIPIECGDIINNNINYLIMDIIEDKYLCIPIDKSITDLKYNLKFAYFKDLDYSKVVFIDKKLNNEYITSVSNNSLCYVLKSYKEYIDNCKNQKITQRGSIITKDNKYYYVYGEEGQDWCTFEISRINIPDFYQLKIKDNVYYTNFSDIKIDKKDSFDTIYLCTEEEIDLIKDIRRNYKEKQKVIEATKNLRFNVGNIIEVKQYKKQRFIIINVCKNTYECISINKIKKGIYDPILIRKIYTRLSHNQSIDGIKWLEKNPNFNLKNLSKEKIIKEIIRVQKEYLKENNEISSQNNQELSFNKNKIVIDGEEYIIKQKIGNMLGCISVYDKGTSHRQMKYFNLDDINQNQKKLTK